MQRSYKEGTAWRKVAQLNGFRVPMGLTFNDDDVREEFQKIKQEFEVPVSKNA